MSTDNYVAFGFIIRICFTCQLFYLHRSNHLTFRAIVNKIQYLGSKYSINLTTCSSFKPVTLVIFGRKLYVNHSCGRCE